MKVRTQMRTPWSGQVGTILCMVILLLVVAACGPVSVETSGQTTPVVTEVLAEPETPMATPTRESPVPAGWETHTSQQCEYAISYPAEMQVASEGTYSRSIAFELADPGEGARNFVYVSVIVQDIQYMGVGSIYNYDPAETQTLLNMQVGESKSSREALNVTSGFTYLRKPDTPIDGHAAQTYENVQPWEFPEGTKEIRHYLLSNGCAYLIGGYLDATTSNQPGAISEELFNQIVATFQLIP